MSDPPSTFPAEAARHTPGSSLAFRDTTYPRAAPGLRHSSDGVAGQATAEGEATAATGSCMPSSHAAGSAGSGATSGFASSCSSAGRPAAGFRRSLTTDMLVSTCSGLGLGPYLSLRLGRPDFARGWVANTGRPSSSFGGSDSERSPAAASPMWWCGVLVLGDSLVQMRLSC